MMGAMIALLIVLPAFAGDSAALSTEEWDKLRAGEVVVHADASGAETRSTAYVLMNAAPDLAWPEIMDLKARIPANTTLTHIREYKRNGPQDYYVAVDMSVFGADVHFTNHYTCRGYTCTYTLDPAEPNDLELCDGTYKVESVGAQSLLTYTSVSRHRIHVPGWVRKWMAVDGVKNLMEKLKARVEHR